MKKSSYFKKIIIAVLIGSMALFSCELKEIEIIEPLPTRPANPFSDEGVIINGVRWATRNVGEPGRFVDNPEDLGMFYQWNGAVGYSNQEPGYDVATADWDFTWKGGFEIPSDDDTWTNNICPEGWRLPTIDEIQKLIDAGSERTETPALGRYFGSGDNKIFLPVNKKFGDEYNPVWFGNYWSADSHSADGETSAKLLTFENLSDIAYQNATPRSYTNTVRCVASEIKEPEPADPFNDNGVLIGSTIWATRNVGEPGRFVDNPEDLGMFYQWNGAVGYSNQEPGHDIAVGDWDFNWNGGFETHSDNDTWTNNICPEGWRLPTVDEFQELIDSGHEWTTNPVEGRYFGNGENKVFLPVTVIKFSYDTGTTLYDGDYWSSEAHPGTAYQGNARSLHFNDDNTNSVYLPGQPRYQTSSARCVKDVQ